MNIEQIPQSSIPQLRMSSMFHEEGVGAERTRFYYRRLIQVMHDDEITVLEGDLHKYASQGFSTGGEVYIEKTLPIEQKLRTLLHEYAHEKLHWAENVPLFDATTRETQAEAVSFIILRLLGMGDIVTSAKYMDHWGAVEDIERVMLDNQSLILDVSQQILTKMAEPYINENNASK